jgi:dienelactone hydrolase
VSTTDVDYKVNGSVMIGRMAVPEGDDRRPAVLIAHEGGGLDKYQRSRAQRFAELGYVALPWTTTDTGSP